MAELKFVFKTLLATLLIIALMQIKIGEKTIEGRVYQILAQSKFTGFLNEVAKGTVQLSRESKKYIQERIQSFNSP